VTRLRLPRKFSHSYCYAKCRAHIELRSSRTRRKAPLVITIAYRGSPPEASSRRVRQYGQSTQLKEERASRPADRHGDQKVGHLADS
jgi:hypothetical protein